MFEKYERHFLFFDALICFIVTSALCMWLRNSLFIHNIITLIYCDKYSFLFNLSTIYLSLFGFMLTGVTILLSNMPERLRHCINYKTNKALGLQIYNVFFSALTMLAVIPLIFLAAVLLPHKYFASCLFICFALTIILISRICRALWILKLLVKISLADTPKCTD